MRKEGREPKAEGTARKPRIKPKRDMSPVVDGATGKRAVKWKTVGNNIVDEGRVGRGVTEIPTGVPGEPLFPREILVLVELVIEVHE